MVPSVIAAVLYERWFAVAAVTLLTLPYWMSGFAKLADWKGAVAEVDALGLKPAALIAGSTIVVQLSGSLLIVSGWVAWLGAGVLAVFTGIATVTAHGFWRPADHASKFRERTIFVEHIGLVGGLMAAATLMEQA